ncbi:glycoside hydrolase family 30 protein [Actinoplanes siamensis]|uniref:galactosylceramidase n=1 Tax=Actinoplanes siamensis TaxID=1223317 RepID=A0A919N585_9ACTN|nr:hypothetical protein [Actinoplanes siamensis]GIF04608.1 hypothetical protein Asi03nite_21460 [Actinoplanes siamensis]
MGAPGWIGNGNILSTDTINYLLSWLGCARQHNLTIGYLTAGQNEKKYDANWTISLRNALNSNGGAATFNWYKNLRSALNSHGHSSVKIVASDDFGWGPADEAQRDPAFGAAISVYGSHYVCGYRSALSNGPSSTNAIKLRQGTLGE